MKATQLNAQRWVEQDEGGYGDDPNDPGGPTKFGITIYDFRSWFKAPEATAEDVAALKIEDAFEIYASRYWAPCSCDLLPPGVDYFTFDSAILSGTGPAIRWVQRAVGALPDGNIGPKTLAALNADHPLDIVAKMEALRRSRLRSLPTWVHFGRGWTNRVNKAVSRAKKLIADAPNALELAQAHPTPAVPGDGVPGPSKAPINPTPEEVTLNGKASSTTEAGSTGTIPVSGTDGNNTSS